MDIIEKIAQTIEPSLDAMGYRVVQLKLAEGSRRRALIVMAERLDDRAMSFDDCTEISQTVSALLDVEDPITGAYDLEVCSPGLDRPLTRDSDYERYAGYEAKLETLVPIDGRKRFRGTIQHIKQGIITLRMPEGHEVEVAYSNVRNAKLVMTDALIEAELKKQKKGVRS